MSPIIPQVRTVDSLSHIFARQIVSPESNEIRVRAPTPYDIAEYYRNGGSAIPTKRPEDLVELAGQTTVVYEDHGTQMSFTEAEEMVFKNAQESTAIKDIYTDQNGIPYSETDYSVTGAHFVGDANSSFAVIINRLSNLIASRTRMKAGNIVLMHPLVAGILEQPTYTSFVKNANPAKNGRWLNIGTLNNAIAVWVCDELPMDRVIVALNDGYNAPGVMIDKSFVLSPYCADYVCTMKLNFLEHRDFVSKVAEYIPETIAKKIADDHGQKQVIILTWDGEKSHLVTHGSTDVDREHAKTVGDLASRIFMK
jgi:hypothetical protein